MTDQQEESQYRLTGDPNVGAGWGITEPFRKDRTPAWASVFALILALVPGMVDRYQTGHWDAYDPTIAVLTATLIALIWTAHYTFRSVQHARQAEERENTRRRLARISMAVAVMAELDYLEPSLALMHGRIAVSEVRFLERPQLRNALDHIDLFSSATAGDLSRFDSIIRQIESHVALYENDYTTAIAQVTGTYSGAVAGPRLLEYNAAWVASIRKMIEGAQAVIPLVKNRLLEESLA
jgi:hypothetical protein